MANDNFPRDPFKRTVQKFVPQREADSSPFDFFHTYPIAGALANVSNRITPWGSYVARRDRELREFYIKEPWLAGAVYSVTIRNAAFNWEVEAPSEKLETALTDMLNGAISGTQFGWLPFIEKFTTDLHTTDNGAFIELIRDPTIGAGSRFKGENAPVIGIANLDSGRCVRTGSPLTPVIYVDRKGNRHKLKWYEVIPVSEHPSPIETMYGVGYSALTRILTVGQIAYSIEVFSDEKISGRHYKAMHFVSGVSKSEIKDVLDRGQEEADNRGEIRFIEPAILASIDPEKPVTTDTIELAAFPDNFNFDEFMRWYIANIALNMGIDYQDLAPLPSGQLGGGTQAEILHRKSSKKGGKFFMEIIQNVFRDYGVIPRPAIFQFTEMDMAEELEKIAVQKEAYEAAAIGTRSNIINGPAGREHLVRAGVLDEDIAAMVPEDFGAEEFRSGGNKPEMSVGGVGSTTAAEDAARSKQLEKQARGIIGRLVNRYMKEKRDGES
jgi:hypothetical protein